jgi:NNMT/PNMT/TEMT family
MHTRNADAPWNDFSPQDYWRNNYETILPADKEIIHRVSSFFIHAFNNRNPVLRAIDVGSGSNIYPALLMLPWTEKILLSDYSECNVRWLRDDVMGDDVPWTWQPFWRELHELRGYNRISEPRKQLREACDGKSEHAGIEKHSVFGLPRAQWQLGTMFFVAESITKDPEEFRNAVGRFVGALQPGAPFAATFMAGSAGYSVGDITYPALQITPDDVTKCLTKLGVSECRVEPTPTADLVRSGYEGMIVATGFVDR